MRFLLDTNIVSENRKGERANPGVREWFASVESEDLGLSVLVLGELRLGMLRLERRDPTAAAHLASWLTRLKRAYRGRVVPVDSAVTEAWARLNRARLLPVIDSLQAAIAKVHGLTLVTRNLDDLKRVDVPLLDPFSD